MQTLYRVVTKLVLAFALLIFFSCGAITIPLTIKNEYFETIDTVIIGTEYIKDDIRYGEVKKIMSPINTVLVRVYTKSNKVAHKVFYLYPHNAGNVLTITKEGRLVLHK